MPDVSQEKKNMEDIAVLQKDQAVLSVKLDNITQNITEIKSNHLVHINDQLTGLNKAVLDLGGVMNDKISTIYARISDLKIENAKQEPSINIVQKIVEYIIIAVIAAGLAYLFNHNMK